MPYIKVIQPAEAEGTLLDIYNQLKKSRGKIAEVHKIQSLNPPTITAHMDLYMRIMFAKSPLKRYQREMMAVIVSQTNDCTYCIKHHAEALLYFWKDQSKIDQLLSDYQKADLSDTDKALCHMAEKLTAEPNYTEKEKDIEQLKKMGLTDRSLLDATLVIAYFNFVNRVVLGLGVDIESDPGGYTYD